MCFGPMNEAVFDLQENTMAFIRDMFDFDKVRFTNVSDLSKDIQKLAQNSIAQTLEAMADDEVPR